MSRLGEDSAWLGEADLPRPRLKAGAAEPVGLSASLLRIVLVCALLGGILWALTGYGIYRLIVG